jgi:hypothetical protein
MVLEPRSHARSVAVTAVNAKEGRWNGEWRAYVPDAGPCCRSKAPWRRRSGQNRILFVPDSRLHTRDKRSELAPDDLACVCAQTSEIFGKQGAWDAANDAMTDDSMTRQRRGSRTTRDFKRPSQLAHLRRSCAPPVRVKVVRMFSPADLFYAGLHANTHLPRRLAQTAVSEGAVSDISDAFLE